MFERVRSAALAASTLGSLVAFPAGAAAGVVTGPARVAQAVHATAAMSTSPIVGMAPSGTTGYWLASTTGGVFTFGTAPFYGSAGNVHLNAPIVGMAVTPTGKGYWLVASDGGIFTYGDAAFHGSTGNVHLNKPIVGIASTPSGKGYWLVASDGGIFNFGDARFHGSTGNVRLAQPIVAMASSATGGGYWLVASDGGIFNFGDAAFHGSAVAFDAAAGAHSIGIDRVGSGYWVPDSLGFVDSVNAPAAPVPTQTVVSTATPSPSALPAETMPTKSIAPSAAFANACWVTNVNAANCNAAALSDINAARAGEGYGPLVLPSNFATMNTVQQVIAVANAERVSRGLPSLPENSYLDSLAAIGAAANGGQGTDPTGPAGYAWGSNISWGDPTALSADFSWMYDDGIGSENIDYTYAGELGCWGHRKNILSPWGGASGAGMHVYNGTVALTELFVENY
ncbi:MAG TPA: hypothetical protein VFH70_01245 [Acidimicrobiales bacterium]|nr:hypothetical protein [Acidimicrobiales bacterium]